MEGEMQNNSRLYRHKENIIYRTTDSSTQTAFVYSLIV